MSLLASLLNQSNVTKTEVEDTKAKLTENVNVELEGVNAPEFDKEEVVLFEDEVASTVDDLEKAFTQQAPKGIVLPKHDDGLDDDEDELETTFQPKNVVNTYVKSDEEAEEESWNRKSIDSRYFGFGGRTVNSFARAGIKCFDDIKGFAHADLLALKGFGRNCLAEILEFLDEEGQSDWLVRRKSKKKQTPVVQEEVVVEEAQEEVVAEAQQEEVVVEDPQEENGFAITADETEETAFDVIAESKIEETPEEETNDVEEVSPAPVSNLKVLVIGSATSTSSNVRVASFENVYADAIRQICEQSQSPSLASVEYGKGWAALGATIRQNGWANNVDILCVSKSFMSRSEVLLELRLLADVVIEA